MTSEKIIKCFFCEENLAEYYVGGVDSMPCCGACLVEISILLYRDDLSDEKPKEEGDNDDK